MLRDFAQAPVACGGADLCQSGEAAPRTQPILLKWQCPAAPPLGAPAGVRLAVCRPVRAQKLDKCLDDPDGATYVTGPLLATV